MKVEMQKRSAANTSFFSHYDEAATSLKICVAESESRVQEQVLKALGNSGHTVLLAKEVSDVLRYQCSGEGPDVLVGCSRMLAGTQTDEVEPFKTPALLLARPEDASFLTAFMKFNPGNDFALLPLPDESLRRSVFSFMLRQHRRKLLGFSAFGGYLLKKDNRQIFFDGAAIKLSPYRFAMAEYLLKHANIPVSVEELCVVCGIERRTDAQRMVGANVAVLAHQLKFDGSHGYWIEQSSPDVYCLTSLPPLEQEAHGATCRDATGFSSCQTH
ncbi:MAG: response regulator transcription factor [Proteobacteria bacterium]|nr:response regulator transcription factor [Pseudomonadota bacterium]